MPWKMREIEKLFRDGREKVGVWEKERVQRVLSEYIRDKRSSARTTKHIDRKLTMLERNLADLDLHESFDAARKKDGKLGNGPLLELDLAVPLESAELPLYVEKQGNV
ncbi:hypothetical protein BDY24DRAFT_418152 [Mrakia frigida]|uniref:uncharacterized protein n=1 Tax=Mrakia frigida TaxID=29902 RepID=UPI003FCBFA37